MSPYNPPLQVMRFMGSRKGDPERGPQVQVNSAEAMLRMVQSGELVWVQGPRRNEVAELVVNDEVPRGGIFVRDIVGLGVSEVVRLAKVDMDRPRRTDLA
jgi:DNA-binding transcriptional LysR family regulator